MPRSHDDVAGTPLPSQIDHDEDRYPSLEKVLSKIAGDAGIGSGPVERIEVYLFKSGEATCRVWPAGAEEPDVAYWPSV